MKKYLGTKVRKLKENHQMVLAVSKTAKLWWRHENDKFRSCWNCKVMYSSTSWLIIGIWFAAHVIFCCPLAISWELFWLFGIVSPPLRMPFNYLVLSRKCKSTGKQGWGPCSNFYIIAYFLRNYKRGIFKLDFLGVLWYNG